MGEEISAESDLTDLVIESVSEHWEPIRWSRFRTVFFFMRVGIEE